MWLVLDESTLLQRFGAQTSIRCYDYVRRVEQDHLFGAYDRTLVLQLFLRISVGSLLICQQILRLRRANWSLYIH